jgi:hypothetical protein
LTKKPDDYLGLTEGQLKVMIRHFRDNRMISPPDDEDVDLRMPIFGVKPDYEIEVDFNE